MINNTEEYNSLILGTWEAKDTEGIKVQMIFHKDNRIEYSVGCDKVSGKWRIDNNIIPNQLDFFLDTDDRLHMKMIFRMISKYELQIHINKNKMELRPANFLIKDDGVEQLTLKRIS